MRLQVGRSPLKDNDRVGRHRQWFARRTTASRFRGSFAHASARYREVHGIDCGRCRGDHRVGGHARVHVSGIGTTPRERGRRPRRRTPGLAAVLTAAYDRIGPVGTQATQLDLVARGVIFHETNAAGRWLRPGPVTADLRPYERQVVALVAERAARGGGRTPAEQTKQWYEAFRDEIVADARARGLVAPRVPRGLRALLYLTLLVPYALACLATGHVLLAIGWFVIPAVLLSLPVRLLSRPVPRGAGREAAAVCRRIRAEFAGVPPPSEPVRGDRRLAYAVALGWSDSGTGSARTDGTVWSNRTGTWTRVEVSRRRGVMAGSDPHTALWGLPGSLVFFEIWGALLTWFTVRMNAHRLAEAWPPLLVVAGWCVWWVCVGGIGRFVYRGIYDLTHPPLVIAGPVVSIESDVNRDAETPDHFYLAVDEADGVAAGWWEVPRSVHDTTRLYQWVRIVATPKLGHVQSTEVLTDAAAQAIRTGYPSR
jgi:hypothetical protein